MGPNSVQVSVVIHGICNFHPLGAFPIRIPTQTPGWRAIKMVAKRGYERNTDTSGEQRNKPTTFTFIWELIWAARKENAASRKIAKAKVLRESRESWHVKMCDICLVCSCILLWDLQLQGMFRKVTGRFWQDSFAGDYRGCGDVPRQVFGWLPCGFWKARFQ